MLDSLLLSLALLNPGFEGPSELWRLGPELPAGAPGLLEADRRTAVLELGDLAWARAELGQATLALPLFDGQGFEFDLQRRVTTGSGGVWFGTYGEASNQLILSVADGAMNGTLRLFGELYQIRSDATGGTLLSLLAPENFPPCGCGAEHAVAGPLIDSGGPTALAAGAGATIIDILVAYTPAVRQASGGVTGVESLINLAEFETNQSYSNAGAPVGIRIVHSYETDYVENGSSSTDLSRFRSTSDGNMDEVHVARNTYGADACTLLTNSGSACGVGYLMTNVTNSFKTSAFNVTLRSCATGNLTFGHELGHNFGFAHDKGNAGSASKPYAYGYRTPNNQYRSVMAYSPGQRVPIFSGPDGAWQGQVMGVPGSEDNARAAEDNAPTIAGWRTSTVPIVDCDNNGVDDGFEIATGAGTDTDNNGVLDACQDFSSDVKLIPVITGGTQNLTLNADESFAGFTYVVLGSLSGTSPGTPVQGIDVPLNVDNYTLFTLSNTNSAILTNTFGVLDGAGDATASINIPGGLLSPFFIFQAAHHVYLLLDGTGAVVHTSSAVPLGFTTF